MDARGVTLVPVPEAGCGVEEELAAGDAADAVVVALTVVVAASERDDDDASPIVGSLVERAVAAAPVSNSGHVRRGVPPFNGMVNVGRLTT